MASQQWVNSLKLRQNDCYFANDIIKLIFLNEYVWTLNKILLLSTLIYFTVWIWFKITFWFIISLTHWGRVTHICVSKLIIIGSDNGLAPERRQAIIWTIARILFIGTLGTYFSQILSEIHTFSFKKMRLKVSSTKWRPFCLGLNELNASGMYCILLKAYNHQCYLIWFKCLRFLLHGLHESRCLKKAVKLNHSVTHVLIWLYQL